MLSSLASAPMLTAARHRLSREDSASNVVLVYPGSESYETLADHISTVYQTKFGAEIEVTYQLLMGLMADHGEPPLSALGIRSAGGGPLFLERYLDQPVEQQLAALFGETLERSEIAEAGNLASSGNNSILLLLYFLSIHLEVCGTRVIIFTGTSLLRRYLGSLGLYPARLAPADPARLGAGEADNWGSYYATKPEVMAGSVEKFRSGLERYFSRHTEARGW